MGPFSGRDWSLIKVLCWSSTGVLYSTDIYVVFTTSLVPSTLEHVLTYYSEADCHLLKH